MDKYIFNMDNEIDKSIKTILENPSENVIYDESVTDFFNMLNPKEKIDKISEDILVKVSKIVSKMIIDNPDLLQKITNSVLENIDIYVSKKKK
jgi:hypothetical protein